MSRLYPSRPLVGVGAVILDGDQVLLVRRGRPPLKGVWSIPGGLLELGEKLVDGVRREIREEVGLEVRVLNVVEVFERITPDESGRIAYHYVLIDYVCLPVSGDLQPGDDVDDAVWVDRGALANYTLTEGTPAVIGKAFQMRDVRSAPA